MLPLGTNSLQKCTESVEGRCFAYFHYSHSSSISCAVCSFSGNINQIFAAFCLDLENLSGYAFAKRDSLLPIQALAGTRRRSPSCRLLVSSKSSCRRSDVLPSQLVARDGGFPVHPNITLSIKSRSSISGLTAWSSWKISG